MSAIDWTAFDWQSFATLVTGGAAVIGATMIGFRQVGITSRQAGIAEAQNTILARQTEIEAQKLKAELFDRRMATFEAAADFILHVRDYGRDQDAEGRVRFFQKYRESQFLFGPSVYRDLTEILDKAQELWIAEDAMRYDRDDQVPRNPDNSKKALEAMSWLLRRLDTLTDVFASHLRFEEQPEA